MTSQTEFRLLTAFRSMQALHDMETSHLKKLASIAAEVKLPADKVIYREGDVGTAIYLIEEGQVAIEMNLPDGNRATVLTVGPGQLFGWSALFPPRRKTASARTVLPAKVIVIDATKLRDLFRTDHNLEHALLQRVTEVVADRLKATRERLATVMRPAGDVQPGQS